MAASTSDEQNDNFIKILKENVVNIREMCNKYKQSGLGIEEFAQRSLDKVQALDEALNQENENKSGENTISEENIKECLQLYAQVLLDVTFCEENVLVDGIFPEKNAKVRVHKLMSMLRQPEVICQHCFPDKDPKDLLGEEILECLLWRRGALLYMYCHTIQEDSTRLDAENKTFIDNCKDGAVYLKQMLQVRKPLKEDRETVITNSEDVFTLLKKGVFSETHVLSMIYAGELCYWHLRHSKTDSDPPNTKDPPNSDSTETPVPNIQQSEKPHSPSDFNAREIGSSILHTYLDIVEGPLKNHGWSADRAKQLLSFLEAKLNSNEEEKVEHEAQEQEVEEKSEIQQESVE